MPDAEAHSELHVEPGHALGTWHAGVATPLDAASWGVRTAEFLGQGFRVQVPRGGGLAALGFARAQARRLASLLGAPWDDTAWSAARTWAEHGAPLTVEGGWEPVFRGPPGPAWCRVSIGCSARRPGVHAAFDLAWNVAAGSELDALPLLSTHHHERARAALRRPVGAPEGDARPRAGLWRTREGFVASSTHGTVLGRTGAGDWWTPAPRWGLVPTWVASEVAVVLDSRSSDLRDVTHLDLVAVDAWGSVTPLAPPVTTRASEATARRGTSVVDEVCAALLSLGVGPTSDA